ncbi:hypothetical protein ACNAMJ_004765 [Escherichia coli]
MNIKTIIAALTIAFSANTAAIDVNLFQKMTCEDKLVAMDKGLEATHNGEQFHFSLKNLILPLDSAAQVYATLGKFEKPEIDLQGVRAKITKRNESICDIAVTALMTDDEKTIIATCKDSNDNERFFKITHNRPVSFYSNATMGAGMQWLKRAKVTEVNADDDLSYEYGFISNYMAWHLKKCGINGQAYDNGFWFF